MMTKRILARLLIVSIAACDKSEDRGLNDAEIMNQLVGSWEVQEGFNIHFFSDGTFVDSSRMDSSYGYPKLTHVLYGGFQVNKGVLNFERVQINIMDSLKFESVWRIDVRPYEVSFDDDTLILRIAGQYDPIEVPFANSLIGSWRSYFASIPVTDTRDFDGVEDVYTFLNDSVVDYTTAVVSSLNRNRTTFRYNYFPPFLSIEMAEGYVETVEVRFQNNQMVWIYDRPARKFSRLQRMEPTSHIAPSYARSSRFCRH